MQVDANRLPNKTNLRNDHNFQSLNLMKNSTRSSRRTRTTWPTENRNQRKYKEQTKGDFDEHKSEPGRC